MNDHIFSIKMRASRGAEHISGAERIVDCSEAAGIAGALVTRALAHSRGMPENINVKIERLNPENCLRIPALKPFSLPCGTAEEGMKLAGVFLQRIGVKDPNRILDLLNQASGMRGAMLVDAETLERLEPDLERGVRATLMDEELSDQIINPQKCHYREAMVLASKVANAPNIIGEICISDDPGYVTGYVAGKEIGYARIQTMKHMGSDSGGRIFIYRGPRTGVSACVDFLEKQPVLVYGLSAPPAFGNARNSTDKLKFIHDRLADLKSRNLERRLAVADEGLINLASSDYLGLSRDERVIEAAAAAMRKYGFGGTGSRLTTGNVMPHEGLEAGLASLCGSEKAILFNSGYAANIGVIPALCGKNDVIFSDELNHASIIDGCRLSGARIIRYAHNDMADLERKARQFKGLKGMIVSDAVFSMDGDIADMAAIQSIADEYGFLSLIDEAHALGVLDHHGQDGDDASLPRNADIVTGSLSKALGAHGGYARGDASLIHYLVNSARSFIFSTALPPCAAAAASAALEILAARPELPGSLRRMTAFFLECLHEYGCAETRSHSAIVPVAIGDEKKAVEAGNKLRNHNILVSAIRYPSVPRGKARLRVAVNLNLDEYQLRHAAKAIAETVIAR